MQIRPVKLHLIQPFCHRSNKQDFFSLDYDCAYRCSESTGKYSYCDVSDFKRLKASDTVKTENCDIFSFPISLPVIVHLCVYPPWNFF